MSAFLYLSVVLIWGSTWIAIHFQLGDVPIIVSIFYRFLIAAIIMMAYMVFSKKLQKVTPTDHLYFALLGVFLFCMNFICFYYSSNYIASGLVAVIFSLATLYNAVNSYIFWGEKITIQVMAAALLGVIGLGCMFYPELVKTTLSNQLLIGVALALLGTLFFSFGNMISRRNSSKGIKPQTAIAYGLIYGAVILFVLTQLTGNELKFSTQPRYVMSLLYLSFVGTVLGFIAYLSLVANLGPSRAAYATVLFPIVALFLSSLLEGYQWSSYGFIGLVFVMVGNVVMNVKKKPTKMTVN